MCGVCAPKVIPDVPVSDPQYYRNLIGGDENDVN